MQRWDDVHMQVFCLSLCLPSFRFLSIIPLPVPFHDSLSPFVSLYSFPVYISFAFLYSLCQVEYHTRLKTTSTYLALFDWTFLSTAELYSWH